MLVGELPPPALLAPASHGHPHPLTHPWALAPITSPYSARQHQRARRTVYTTTRRVNSLHVGTPPAAAMLIFPRPWAHDPLHLRFCSPPPPASARPAPSKRAHPSSTFLLSAVDGQAPPVSPRSKPRRPSLLLHSLPTPARACQCHPPHRRRAGEPITSLLTLPQSTAGDWRRASQHAIPARSAVGRAPPCPVRLKRKGRADRTPPSRFRAPSSSDATNRQPRNWAARTPP